MPPLYASASLRSLATEGTMTYSDEGERVYLYLAARKETKGDWQVRMRMTMRMELGL